MDKKELVSNIRNFNRIYTNILGLLNKHILDSEFSLTEIRVLYEISNSNNCKTNILVNILKIDKGYLSRIISKFEKNDLVYKEKYVKTNILKLTKKGIKILNEMDEKSTNQIEGIISKLDNKECLEINKAINTIKKNLLFSTNMVKIRPFVKSDIDFIINEQMNLFEKEYGFSNEFWKTHLIDEINNFINNFNEKTDCMYVLDYEGVILGSIAIVHVENKTAQLRFFYVNSKLRGIGAGNKLIDTVIQFCKEKKYDHLFLWTANKLISARKLYSFKGFEITETHSNTKWGVSDLIEERWDLDLKK